MEIIKSSAFLYDSTLAYYGVSNRGVALIGMPCSLTVTAKKVGEEESLYLRAKTNMAV